MDYFVESLSLNLSLQPHYEKVHVHQDHNSYHVHQDKYRETHSEYRWEQSILGFATMGLAANLDIAATALLTDPCHSTTIVTLGITTSNFGRFCSEIVTTETFGGRYT